MEEAFIEEFRNILDKKLLSETKLITIFKNERKLKVYPISYFKIYNFCREIASKFEKSKNSYYRNNFIISVSKAEYVEIEYNNFLIEPQSKKRIEEIIFDENIKVVDNTNDADNLNNETVIEDFTKKSDTIKDMAKSYGINNEDIMDILKKYAYRFHKKDLINYFEKFSQFFCG